MATDIRCAGCGKELEKGSEVVKIEIGNLRGKVQVANSKCWGLLHRSCFNRSIESPKAALEEIRRLARDST